MLLHVLQYMFYQTLFLLLQHFLPVLMTTLPVMNDPATKRAEHWVNFYLDSWQSWWLSSSVVKSIGLTVTLTQRICAIHRPTGMRVDLSPRLGRHTVANQPPTTVLLSFTFILPRNGVESHSRCETESWTELELAFHLTVTFLIRLQGPHDSLH